MIIRQILEEYTDNRKASNQQPSWNEMLWEEKIISFSHLLLILLSSNYHFVLKGTWLVSLCIASFSYVLIFELCIPSSLKILPKVSLLDDWALWDLWWAHGRFKALHWLNRWTKVILQILAIQVILPWGPVDFEKG